MKAFTIAELLVVLVISSIIIGLSMLILSLVNKQIYTINSNTNKATEVRLLEKALLVDFNNYNLTYNTKQQQLQCFSPIDTVYYFFNSKYVIRNLDTLRVSIHEIVRYVDGERSTTSNIDALELQLSEKNRIKKLFIYKTKDAAFYLNNDGI